MLAIQPRLAPVRIMASSVPDAWVEPPRVYTAADATFTIDGKPVEIESVTYSAK